jgi:hypothetical protein
MFYYVSIYLSIDKYHLNHCNYILKNDKNIIMNINFEFCHFVIINETY